MSETLRVLLLEDNLNDCELVLRQLRRAGFELDWVRVDTEEDYLARLGDRFDIILSDFSLPQFDGLRALEALKKTGLNVPFILISGTVGEETAVLAMKHGAADYLLKDRLARLGEAVRHAIEAARQVSERERAAQSLRSKTAFLEAMVDSSPDAILIVDMSGKKLLQNRKMNDFWEIPDEIANGQSDTPQLQFVASQTQDPVGFVKKVEWLYANPEEIAREEIFLTNGRVFDRYSSPVKDPFGDLYGRIWIFRDITERKRSEMALAESARRLELAVQAAGMGVWEVNVLTGEFWFDAQFCVLFGMEPRARRSPKPVMDEMMARLIHPDDLAPLREKLADFLTGQGGTFDAEFRVVRMSDGEQRILQSKGTIWRGHAGESMRALGVQWDVTESRVRERELTKALSHEKELSLKALVAERAKGEFLATMSHEIRTPMNGILGFSQMLVDAPLLPQDCRDAARTIYSSSEALLRILDDVLDFSSIGAGGLQIQRAPFSPKHIVDEIHTLLVPQASRKGLNFTVLPGEGVPDFVEGDAGRVRQILLNLAGNAIKFTETGEVTIMIRPRSEAGSKEIVLDFIVQDTGPGIALDHNRVVFEPFSQLDSSLSRRYGGVGLGLSISRQLAELMGGKLVLQSVPGQGTGFILNLPFLPVREALQPATKNTIVTDGLSLAAEHPLNILVVEDDLTNNKLLVGLLRKVGYDPKSACNGREAIDAFQGQVLDCIFMDLQMPEMDGLEATQKIREIEVRSSRSPCFIAAVTANILVEDKRKCFEYGMNAYLNKPIKREQIMQVLLDASHFN